MTEKFMDRKFEYEGGVELSGLKNARNHGEDTSRSEDLKRIEKHIEKLRRHLIRLGDKLENGISSSYLSKRYLLACELLEGVEDAKIALLNKEIEKVLSEIV